MRNRVPKSTILKQLVLGLSIVLLTLALSACSNLVRNNSQQDLEESGTELSLDETYDQARNGARLVLVYDAQSNSFKGHVENTTLGILKMVRAEVHLSNGVELGPTTPTDLGPGESMPVSLTAISNDFDGWTAHAEVGEGGSGEHIGEDGGEHDGEGRSEHYG